MKARDILIYLAVKNRGDFTSIADALKKKKPVNAEEVEEVAAKYPNAVTILDDDYPSIFRARNAPKPPFVLFFKHKPTGLRDIKFAALVKGGNLNDYEKKMEPLVTKAISQKGLTIIERDRGSLSLFATTPDCKAFEFSPYPNEMWHSLSEERVMCVNAVAGMLASEVDIIHIKENHPSLITITLALTLGADINVLPHEIEETETPRDLCNNLLSYGANPLSLAAA